MLKYQHTMHILSTILKCLLLVLPSSSGNVWKFYLAPNKFYPGQAWCEYTTSNMTYSKWRSSHYFIY